MEHHVTGHITDSGVGLQGSVIKEANGTKVSVLGRLDLVGSQQTEDDKHGGVDFNGIVDQRSNGMVDKVDMFGGNSGRRVVGFGVLGAGTKYRAVTVMWGILVGGRRKVLKFVQGFRNLRKHGDIASASSVIPGEGEYAEEVGGKID